MGVDEAERRVRGLRSPVRQLPNLHLRLGSEKRSGDVVIRTKDLLMGYEAEPERDVPRRELFKATTIELRRQDCAALIGPNGAGKTTFLKTNLGQIPPLAGEVTLGTSLHIGYFAQAHEGLDPKRTLIEEIESVARSHGWDIRPLHLFEFSVVEEQLREQTESTFFHPSEVELNRISQMLLDAVERLKPTRLVIDSLSELRMLVDTPLRYRRQILRFKQFFAGRKCTVLLLDDRTATRHDLQVESIAHGVVVLEKLSPEYGVARRQINVVKIRGSRFREGNHDVVIRRGGMHVFPRLIAADHHADFERANVSTGLREFDLLLGGGLGRGTSNMMMGPPGTGKSTLSVRAGLEAANRGERVAFFLFDENETQAKLARDFLADDESAHRW
jgi:KaiC/GvpD/RAD55 family RecA-like ATPase